MNSLRPLQDVSGLARTSDKTVVATDLVELKRRREAKERASAKDTQLDRIERKLDLILSKLDLSSKG